MDRPTGFEIELVLPEGMNRIELLEDLAPHFDAELELFETPSKVPVPPPPRAAPSPEVAARAVVALMQDIARHHEARLARVAPDGQFFFLMHRAGQLVRDGEPILSVVHDNTLPGGERVAEVITQPLMGAQLEVLDRLLELLSNIEGVSLPESAALHVHVDAAGFERAESIHRLLALYLRSEPALRQLAETPDAFRKAERPPPALLEALAEAAAAGLDRAAAVAHIERHQPHKGYGLNLRNLAKGAGARTVELKLARATLDRDRVHALRRLYLGLVAAALDPDLPVDDLPTDPDGLQARLTSLAAG